MTSPKFNTCSPRPIPQFFNDLNILTTKKERYSSTPVKRKIPPRPPSKSVSQISRLSCTLNNTQKAQIISFREENQPQLSRLYDETLSDSYFKQCFIIEDKIGSGSFGDVYKVKCKEDGKYYAIKVAREKFKGKLDREERLNEVFKHEQLPSHDHLVNLYRAWEEKQRLYIQSELCTMSLSTLAETNHDIAEDTVWRYLVDLLKALDYIHSYNLIHLDIKPENIFISQDGLCKLGDFGLILDINTHRYNDATEGDPKYLATELMRGIFTKSADIFSLGMTILELASDLDLPSRGDGWHMLRSGNIPENIFSDMSSDLKEIVTMMLCPDYALRPTASELLSHPVVAKHEKRRRYELKLKKILIFLQSIRQAVYNSCLNICGFVNNLMLPMTNYLGNFFPQKPATDSANLNSSPIINHQRNYISSYLDQYSDDEAVDHRQISNSSLDLSFTDDETFPDNSFSCRNLCSTINRNAQPNNFMISQMSPLLNLNQNGGDNIESIKVRLTFDEFSSDEMELTENEEDDEMSARQRPTNQMSSIRIKPNISRKNLMQTFDEIELDSSNS